jgi:hypothetical protein
MTYFTGEQVSLLLKPIHPKRVLMRDGMSYVEGYDVKAELNRVFGFGRWSVEILDQSLIAEAETKTRNNKDAWYVVYKTSLRLTVSAPDGTPVCRYEESHVGESTHPVRGEAHGNALTNSWTYALKRCASNLGDQFGLSLYGKGSMDALVRWTLVRPDQGEGPAVNDQDVPQVTAEAPEDHAAPELHVQAPPPPVEQRAEPSEGSHAKETANGNGAARGETSRPAQQDKPAAQGPAGEPDEEAQPFADEAHEARTVAALQAIHIRAREARKLPSLIRSPSTGGVGGLGQYMNWKRGVLEKADKALAALRAAAAEAEMSDAELEEVLKVQVGHGIEEATPEEMDQVAAGLARALDSAAAAVADKVPA